jgi:hypothetical protein
VAEPDRDEAREDEDEGERLDRELLELLNELRVVMPGVQVLFGFLLTVPFQQRFETINAFQRDVYTATLLLTAAAAAFLMTPSAFHRLTFRAGEKPYLVKFGTTVTVIGMVLLALAMNGALLLLTDILYHGSTVAVMVGVSVALYVSLWFGVASIRRLRGKKAW